MSKFIEFNDGEENFYLTEEEVVAGLEKANLSLGSHLLDLGVLRATQKACDDLEAKINAVWSLIDTNMHSHYVPSMCIAEALGGTLVNGKWKKP